nr:NAD(P)-dependent oxidoreductase [Tissierella sp.]
MKILVTGGYGFIGSHLVERLIKEKHDITIIDDLSTPTQLNFTDNVTFFKIGIQDAKCEKIFADFKFDIVVHLAFKSLPKEGEKEYGSIYHENNIGLSNVLFFSQKYFVDKVIVASSYQVYGKQEIFPIDESSEIDMAGDKIGSYLEREYFCRKYSEKGLNVVILRLGCVYGPRQPEDFIQLAMTEDQGNKPEAVTIINKMKDYIYISDVVEAIYRTCEKPTSKILNISSGTWIKQSEVQEIIDSNIKLANKPMFNYIDDHSRPRYLLDNQKASLELDWSPKYSIEDGIKKTIDWSIKNIDTDKIKVASETESVFSAIKKRWFLSASHKYIENFILFIIFAALMIILERKFFIKVDLFIIYIVTINIYYGWWHGIIAMILSVGAYIGFNMDYSNLAMTGIFNNMNQDLYIAMYIVLGGTTGYLADRIRGEKTELENDLNSVKEELYFTIGMYNKSIEIKNSLQETIESNEDSLGKIYNIISRLNNIPPADVFSEAAKVFSQMLRTESVHIYRIDSKNNIKIAAVEGNIKYPRLLNYEDYDFLETMIKDGNVFINKDFVSDLPMACAPIIQDDVTVAIVLLDGLEFKKLTYQFLNTLKVLTYLVANAMSTADRCQISLPAEEGKYLKDTLIMRADWFKRLIKQKEIEDAQDETSNCLLIFRKNMDESNVRLYNRIKKVLTRTDYVGEVGDTKIAILLNGKNKEEVAVIKNRLKNLGLLDVYIETLRGIM